MRGIISRKGAGTIAANHEARRARMCVGAWLLLPCNRGHNNDTDRARTATTLVMVRIGGRSGAWAMLGFSRIRVGGGMRGGRKWTGEGW